MRQRDGRIKRIRGQDWGRLIKAHATLPLMSSSTPSVKVNSRFLNPLLVLSAGVTRHVIGSVYQCPRSHRLRLAPAQPATCSSWPSDTSSNLATQIMLSRQRGGGGWHDYTNTHAHTCRCGAATPVWALFLVQICSFVTSWWLYCEQIRS